MADETVDLQFLAEQGRRILAELRDNRDEMAGLRSEMELTRGDNRRVLGELASNRAAMAGLGTEMTVMRGDVATMRATMDAILTELREMRIQNASFDNRLRRLEEPGAR
jgi:chromosome segregation ATPase